MNKRNTKVAGLMLILLLLAACGSVMKMTGKLAAKLMTQKTADLSKASVNVQFLRNVYPAATNTEEVKYLGEDWREGGNMVTINFLKREGIGMYSIDGRVLIDGEEVPHVANGFYGKWIDDNDFSAKTVRVETSSGQVAEFVVTPPPPISILSVNGKKEEAEVNLNSDLHLQLASPDANANTEFSVSLMHDIMSIRTFVENGIFKFKKDITIPAAMWRNSSTQLAPITGPSWLRVERFNVNTKVIRGVGATQVVGTSIACVPVNVTGDLDKTIIGTLKGDEIQINENLKSATGSMNVNFNKPNAFYGRPLSSGKKFAMASFTVRATKLKQRRTKTSSSTRYTATQKITTTTTTITTKKFPTLPDAYWESLVSELYVDFEQLLKKNYDITLIPVEQVVQAPSYSALEPIADEVTEVEVEKSYKNTKNLIPTTLSAIVKSVSSTFASDRIDSRLIRELGVDGLIAVTIDLEMPWESFSLSPRMSIRISGGPNGYKAGPTIFVQGVVSGNGLPLDEAKMDADYVMDILPNVIRKKELFQALEKGFKELATQEKERSFEALWALK